MKRLLTLLACVSLLSSVGCCCLNSRVNECGPYGADLAGGGGCLAKFARAHGAKKKCGCHHCGGYGGMYADPMYGMDTCGGGGCGFDGGMGMMGATPDARGPGCGCGGGGGEAALPMIPPAPPAQYAPQAVPTPAPIAEPTPAETNIPAPPETAVPAAPTTYQPAPTAPNVQNVSVEEFQRLPGTIISGPTTSSVAAPPASAPVSSRRVVPTAAQPGVRPANWQPTRTY